MLRGLKVSRPLIANMIPFVNMSNFVSEKKNLHYGLQSSTLGYFTH